MPDHEDWNVSACKKRGLLYAWDGDLRSLLAGREAKVCGIAKKGRRARSLQNSWFRNGRARELSPNSRALPCLPANYLSEASKVICEAGAFWARSSTSARLFGSL